MHLDLIVVGRAQRAESALWQAEAQLARHLLDRCLPAHTQLVHLPASQDGMASSLAALLSAMQLPDEAWVLFLPHWEVLPAPQCIARLAQAADITGPRCAHSNLNPPNKVPDYLTLRGLERYEEALVPRVTMAPWQGELCLARAADLRNPARLQSVAFLDNAYYHDFSGYQNHRREEMLALLPPVCGSLLDVGGGSGGFLTAVKEQRPACRTALVELSATACAMARAHGVDRVWQGDFLTLDLQEEFDCIAFHDVLEHVVEPPAMLSKARQMLRPEGCVIASLPNVGHWSVVADLLEGRWDYAPAGIHCITHLRFFTRRGIEALFAECGFVIETWQAATMPAPPWLAFDHAASDLAIDRESLATVAWHLRARPRRR